MNNSSMKVLFDRFLRRTLAFLGYCRETALNLSDPPLLSRESGPKTESLPNRAVVTPAVTWRVGYHIIPSSYRAVAPLFQILRYLVATLSLAASSLAVSQAQIVANPPSIGGVSKFSTPSVSLGIRPDHLWSVDYVKLLWSDTGAVLTAPVHWDEADWIYAGFAAAGIGAAASLDNTIKDNVQAHRTAGEDRFFNQYQNLGAAWAFGLIGTFEIWGEAGGNTTAKNTAMDALTASIIGPGLIGTSMKYAVGRVRPNTATSAFEFKPFSNNQSFPSGHASEAFAVATAIAENYPVWWVQTLCYGGAGLVGYARIEQNAHYASDVVAGALLGWSVAHLVVHRHNGPPNPHKLSCSLCATGNGARLVFFKSF